MIELSIGYYLLEIEGRGELGYTDEYKSELISVHNHLKEVVITNLTSSLRSLKLELKCES